ncbi:PIN domain-containing protein [Bosea psychrotolerans]|uniref:Putative nucleic acid-binding protein n=1 Tax=Bosea psychrotolerans TaxID=1871628 RepID=A0A2S4LUU2_9HYPH|nr:PIN domain-containing protein [Bosea psychrotolerans]POR46227.1 putative nucleic acid-binding protein [Bosea psychrotolerans]
MTALVALDTNILVYAAGLNDGLRFKAADAIRIALGPDRTLIATQVLGEFFNVLVGKFRQERSFARRACELWMQSATIRAPEANSFARAFELATEQHFQIWDALILVTAAEAGCRILVSEDMQHGFVHRGVTVVNPFAEPPHPLLADALRHAG